MKRSEAPTNINTAEYWNEVYGREAERNRVRVDQLRMAQLLRWVDIRHLELERPLNLLDAGCGLGDVERAMPSWVNVFGLDISDKAIKSSSRKAQLPTNYQIGSVENIPWANQRFDVVWCGETVEHLDDPVRGISELFRVTGEQGLTIISIPYRGRNRDKEHMWEFSPSDISDWATLFSGELLFLDCHLLPGWETAFAVFRSNLRNTVS